jgi:cyclopropane-fatty-acyl-phospholipid synthase
MVSERRNPKDEIRNKIGKPEKRNPKQGIREYPLGLWHFLIFCLFRISIFVFPFSDFGYRTSFLGLFMTLTLALAERAWLPDGLIRWGIRRQLKQRLRDSSRQAAALQDWVDRTRSAPIAVHTDAANQQHYEVPPEFFQLVLGPRLKYSACWWETAQDLPAAEEDMLDLTCRRAGLADGQTILELGCGWGSLSLWMAEKYPRSRIVSVSNSKPQREYIEGQCRQRGLGNLRVVTADMNVFQPKGVFDRVVSVEMFEHMRNFEALLKRIAGWLQPQGKLFVHIFCHKEHAYPFEDAGDDNWMGRHFFTGGLMPSFHYFDKFTHDLKVQEQWAVNGQHYARTAEAWLHRLDAHHAEALAIFQRDLGPKHAGYQVQRWRMFFMACAELFAYHEGSEWLVGHYLLTRTS